MAVAAGSPFGKVAEPETVDDLMTDQVALAVPGYRRRGVAGGDDPPLRVADDQRRRGTGVVVLEQLEQEPEAALGASQRLAVLIALGRRGAPRAVGADEHRH